MYYVELPQTSINAANGLGVNRSLVTYHGMNDLQTLLVKQFCTMVPDKGAYMYPIDISAAIDFSSEATINNEVLYEFIQKKIFACPLIPS